MGENHPVQWIFGIVLVVALVLVVQSGLNPKTQLTRTQRTIRVVGGGVWLIIVLAGMLLRLSGD